MVSKANHLSYNRTRFHTLRRAEFVGIQRLWHSLAQGVFTMACWTRSQTVGIRLMATIVLVGIALLSASSAEKEEQAGRQERVNVDALRFVAGGRPLTNLTSESAGFVLIADGAGPQFAVLTHAGAVVTCVRQDEVAEVRIPLPQSVRHVLNFRAR